MQNAIAIPSDSGRLSQNEESILSGTIRLSIDTLNLLRNNGGMLDITATFIDGESKYYLIDTNPQGFVSPYKREKADVVDTNKPHGDRAIDSSKSEPILEAKPAQTEQISPEKLAIKVKSYLKALRGKLKTITEMGDREQAIAAFAELEEKVLSPESWSVFESDPKAAKQAKDNLEAVKKLLNPAITQDNSGLVAKFQELCDRLNLEAESEFEARFGVSISEADSIPVLEFANFITELHSMTAFSE